MLYYVEPFDIYISASDAAFILGISRQRVYKLASLGRLKSQYIRGSLGISGRAISQRHAARHPENAQPKNLGELDAWLRSRLHRRWRAARAKRGAATTSPRQK